MIRRERLTAEVPGEFAVFLIGMRVNRPLMIHKWLPVARAMTRMLDELYRQPELGLLHHEAWFARTVLILQYWRTMDQLLAYARDKAAAHLPAWAAFNRAIGTSGSVGIWHETYAVRAGTYETIYVNMPAFGLGRAGTLHPASKARQSARGRLDGKTQDPPDDHRP